MDAVLVNSALLQDHSDFNSPSPHSNFFDGSPNPGSPYDAFDFAADGTFPHTPSYNGSYQNSPYSSYSDLPPFDPNEDTLGLYVENPSGISITDEYNPSEYDVPNSSGPYALDHGFMNALDQHHPHVSVSVTPPLFDNNSPSAFDQGSPASSNGAEDDVHSHASSTSSYMQSSSPRLDFTQNFQDRLSFHSPNWAAGPLPDDRTSPPLHKPPSPPQLVIPDTTSPGGAGVSSPPIINAPDGDGGLMSNGPQLHIVPATPISGGGDSTQPVPFQETLANLHPGVPQSSQQAEPSSWHSQLAPHTQRQANQFTDQSFNYPGSNLEQGSPAMSFGGETQMRHTNNVQDPQQSQQYLLPHNSQRARSLSDTSLRPPVWDTMPMMHLNNQGSNAGVDAGRSRSHDGRQAGGTVNMNDVLPGPSSDPLLQQNSLRQLSSSAGPHQTSFNGLMNPMLDQRFTFGLPAPSAGSQFPSNSTDFLTVDSGIRRTKSDAGGRTHHRQVRSLDLGGSQMMYPPPGHSQQEFIRAAATSRQFLHPSEPVASITRGHVRRSSSGERSAGLGGLVGGWSSNVSSGRPSPYPSPRASPRPGYDALPDVTGAMGGRRVMQVDMGGGDGGAVPMTVTRVNVTTPSTADASQKRRKQPANFQCPVPGCGSTFTRHFNLKGHLRSHAEEKPYQCKWPGCGKGFARQHDCKRHEQLHLNIRPYPCEGCKKNFARMDALNRHLRSEGGAECRKLQEELTPGGPTSQTPEGSSEPVAGPSSMKPDPDGGWGAGGLML